MRRRSLAASTVALALLTGCGSTVPLTQQVAVPDALGAATGPAPVGLGTVAGGGAAGGAGPSGGEVGAPVVAGGPAGPVRVGGAGGSAVPGSAPGAGAARGSGGAGTAQETAASRPVPQDAPLVIGFPTRKGGAAAASALGIQGAATGDQENQMEAVVDALNARGGVLGRRVELAPHDGPAVASNPDAADAEACAAWVDAKAFAVVNVTLRRTLRACLAKAGIPVISSLSLSTAAEVYGDTLPGVYAPSAMSVDRYVRAVVDRLVARGFFTGWDAARGRPGPFPVKIGMQSFEDADGQHVVEATRRALARHGLALDDVEAHTTDLADNSSSSSAAVLRFRARGITHVIDANLLFFQTAASQDYRPRYVVQDTINTPALLAQNVPASQLRGAMGAGYLPLYEVEDPQDTSPEATRCLALMRAAGEDTSAPVAKALMLHTCDAVLFLEKALTAGGDVSAAALRDGAARIGTVPSHLTYGTRITAARRDGATRVRDFAYDEACTCFRHTSATTYPAD